MPKPHKPRKLFISPLQGEQAKAQASSSHPVGEQPGQKEAVQDAPTENAGHDFSGETASNDNATYPANLSEQDTAAYPADVLEQNTAVYLADVSEQDTSVDLMSPISPGRALAQSGFSSLDNMPYETVPGKYNGSVPSVASQNGNSIVPGNNSYRAAPVMLLPDLSTYRTVPMSAVNTDQEQVSAVNTDQEQSEASEQPPPPRTQKRRFYHRTPGYRHFARLRAATSYSLRARLLMAFLVFCLLTPLIIGTGEGINTYIIYSHARSGIQHLLNIRTIFLGGSNHASGLLDASKLNQAHQQFSAAHSDFLQLRDDLNQDMTVGALAAFLPKQIATARALSQIGVDVTDMGQNLVSTALVLAPTIRSNPLANSSTNSGPLITQAMLDRLDQSIVYILPLLNDVAVQSHNLSLDTLPLSSNQRDEFNQLVQFLPTAQADLTMAHNLMGALGWILGVGQPRHFLVQTMDRAELRPTGGFTGQYGELDINGGRLAPLTLKDIGALEDFNPNSPVQGNLAPSAYRSWWPFANWGLRDSNLSADFPTSARMAMNLYKLELNQQVDGVVYFSPFLISRMLQVIGPLQITKYQDTVTAQNLEERLHYYQLDNAGIRKIKLLNHTPDAPDSDVRKLFTAEVARVLMDHLRHAPPDELITLAGEMLHDLQTKDLQIYVDNPQIQNLLAKYNSSSQIDTFAKHDGFMVVQANVNATKASQYTNTILHDTVTLDANGGATHLLQIRLVYNQGGPVYGMDTLRDYVRVYVPEKSKLLWGDGFEAPGFNAAGYYCGAGYGPCPSPDIYQNGDLLCPTGIDNAGITPDMLNDPYSVKNHPFRYVGPPSNTTSDMPGRGMFGGYMVVPKNCTATATISWYVPPITHGSYSLLVQRQPSTLPELDITLQTTPGSCKRYEKSGLHFDGIVGGPDMTFSLKMKPPSASGNSSCYPQPPV
ncbi:MAG TPA: DUF4012 domain-containing protein [Ktedonobacteraceae bacterium]|nr:DUF4012 domain-containing protein [Ktedonobacteraceae bacterium]